MLRSDDERDRERGGEAPMEIDSPPPFWLKPPTSPAFFNTPINSVNLTTNTTTTPLGPSTLSNSHSIAFDTTPSPSSSTMEPASSPVETLTIVKTPTVASSPLNHRSSILRSQVSPLAVCSSNGKSPLRTCHTNADAAIHLRRLTTATFNTSPSQKSPTIMMMMNRKGNTTPQSQKKKSSSKGDPTKAAAAAALVTSSSTNWHMHLPIILMNYFQLIFNTVIGVGILYLAFSATATVLHDAQLKVDERLQVMMAEIASCSRQYVENRCNPEYRVPAMEKVCTEWETCMSRDPSTTSRSSLHAETIAEILNGFFGAISTKTYIFMISGSVLIVVLFNAAFYFGRSSQQHSPSNPTGRFGEYPTNTPSHYSSYLGSNPGSPLMVK